jgi:hypothetical protein
MSIRIIRINLINDSMAVSESQKFDWNWKIHNKIQIHELSNFVLLPVSISKSKRSSRLGAVNCSNEISSSLEP